MFSYQKTVCCEKRGSDFDSKMHDVLVIYKQLSLQFDGEGNLLPFEGMPVHTLSYDMMKSPECRRWILLVLQT